MVRVSVFHLESERAAGRVETVHRIAGHEGQLVDRFLRDQVPIDDIAEHLVDADAVLIHGKAFRCADDWAGDVTAIIDVKLKLVSGLTAQ